MNERGFTLPEVVTTIGMSALFVALIMMFTFSYWRYGFLLEADLDTFITRLNAGDYLRDNVGTSSGMIIQNSIPDSNTHNPDPDTPSGLYWKPLHAIPGNLTAFWGTEPLLYFSRPSINTSDQVVMNGTQPFEDEYVIYLNGTTKQLLVRTLANPSVSNNKLKTSCPPDSATASCPADRIIVNDLASVEMRYFSRSGNLIDWRSAVDSDGKYIGPDFPVVEVVEFKINITKKPILQKTNATSNSTIIRVALRNT